MYRRMMRISWTEHKSNEEVLEMTISKRSLAVTIKKRKLQYFRHLIRQNGIQRLLLEGKIEGKRGCGRSRIMWMDNIKAWTGLKYGKCVWRAEDWIEWKSMTANLLKVDATTWWWPLLSVTKTCYYVKYGTILPSKCLAIRLLLSLSLIKNAS